VGPALNADEVFCLSQDIFFLLQEIFVGEIVLQLCQENFSLENIPVRKNIPIITRI